jgi:UDP-2,4-diacetamido-2,4,6-trideoxy-beta-L-altropyranose hydrolase
VSGQVLGVRVDATPEAGLGHFMRCLAIAEGWRDDGGEVVFAGRWPEDLAARLAREGIRGVKIRASHPDPRDLEETLETFAGASAVVVDGYGFDAAYHDGVAIRIGCVVAVDDVGHRDAYGGDVLLNPNLGAERLEYRKAPAARLLGPRYALFRRDFRLFRNGPRRIVERGSQVLVALGGGDRSADWPKLLDAIAGADASASFRIVPGFDRAALERGIAALGPRFRAIHDTARMPAHMMWADVAVSAAGVTAWELAFLGVPAILVSVADNQRPSAAALAHAGAAIDLGPVSGLRGPAMEAALESLLADLDRREEMSERGRALLDGRGVERVIAAIREHVAKAR